MTLSGILERMNIAAPVAVAIQEDAIVLNIKGDGGGLLIGKRGQKSGRPPIPGEQGRPTGPVKSGK